MRLGYCEKEIVNLSMIWIRIGSTGEYYLWFYLVKNRKRKFRKRLRIIRLFVFIYSFLMIRLVSLEKIYFDMYLWVWNRIVRLLL